MPVDRPDDAQYLREKAGQFRELARTYKTEISAKLLEIAHDLEARATEIDRKRSQAAAAPAARRVSSDAPRSRRPPR